MGPDAEEIRFLVESSQCSVPEISILMRHLSFELALPSVGSSSLGNSAFPRTSVAGTAATGTAA